MEEKLEIEFKSELTYDDHLTVKNYFPFGTPNLQENTYYDTKGMNLYDKGIMCRTRKIKDNVFFTLKEPTNEGLMEYEFLMTDDFYKDPNCQVVLDRFDLQVQDLSEVAFSNTVRYEFKDAYGTWCLDVTQFAHHKDYEIEYELFTDDPLAEKHFLQTLKAMGLEYQPIHPKFVRALGSTEQDS